MSYTKRPPLGQATMANSEPVVIASNQTAIPVTATNSTATNLKAEVIGTGTFATQATLAAETTKVIGTVNVAAAQTIAVTNSTATNLKTQAETYMGGTAVSSGNPLLVSLANNAANATAVKVNVASGGIASGGIASGAVASGAVSSGAIASGALAAGSIAVGAITAGDTSIATTEDTASAAGEHLLKVGVVRKDTPVANAEVSTDGDYGKLIADNFGKLWTAGTAQEDVAHVAGEALKANGVRRIDTAASSAGTSADWATMDASAEGALWTTLTPTTTSGLSVANFTSGDTYTALTNSAQVIKASAGNMYGYYMFNPNAATAYVMIYNIAAASVTVGTSTAQMVFAIPAGAAANVNFPYPITFSNAGWSIAAATTGGGNTAPTTALEVMIYYK